MFLGRAGPSERAPWRVAARRPERIPPGQPIQVAVDPGLGINLWTSTVPTLGAGGWSRISANLRCRVSAEAGARLSVLPKRAVTAEFVVLVVRRRPKSAEMVDYAGPDDLGDSLSLEVCG